MDSLLELIKNRAPRYSEKYDALIKKFSQFGGGSKDDKFAEGRYFSNAYEIYIYAVFIGLYNENPLPVASEDKLKKFWEIKNWKPQSIVDTLISGIIGQSNIDLYDLTKGDESLIKSSIDEIIDLMEKYANGGFEFLQSKYDEDSGAFDDNENVFLELIIS